MKRIATWLVLAALIASCSSAPAPAKLQPQPPAMTETITVTSAGPYTISGIGFITEIALVPSRHAHVEEHGVKKTATDPVTTFAIDVDRASYTNVRRYIKAGQTPPPDAVRVEELINYFTYSYPQPSGSDPLSITTEIASCPWNPRNRLLRVGLQGRGPTPNHLVIDASATEVTIAKDVKVQIAFDETKVTSYRQLGYENRALANADFKDDKKGAGDLRAGHTVTALYELAPVQGARGAVAEVRIRYKEPESGASRELRAAADDTGKSAWDASADFQFAAAVAELGMILRGSKYAGSASYEEVLQLARIARGSDLDGLRGELITLAQKGREIGDSWMRAAST